MSQAIKFLKHPPEYKTPAERELGEIDRRRQAIEAVLGSSCQVAGCSRKSGYFRKPDAKPEILSIVKNKDISRERLVANLVWFEALCTQDYHNQKNSLKVYGADYPEIAEWLRSPDRNRWELPPDRYQMAITKLRMAYHAIWTHLRPRPDELPHPTQEQILANRIPRFNQI